MNRADRRRFAKMAKEADRVRRLHGVPDWRCPFCDESQGTLIELCSEGCCDPSQRCAACGLPVT